MWDLNLGDNLAPYDALDSVDKWLLGRQALEPSLCPRGPPLETSIHVHVRGAPLCADAAYARGERAACRLLCAYRG